MAPRNTVTAVPTLFLDSARFFALLDMSPDHTLDSSAFEHRRSSRVHGVTACLSGWGSRSAALLRSCYNPCTARDFAADCRLHCALHTPSCGGSMIHSHIRTSTDRHSQNPVYVIFKAKRRYIAQSTSNPTLQMPQALPCLSPPTLEERVGCGGLRQSSTTLLILPPAEST